MVDFAKLSALKKLEDTTGIRVSNKKYMDGQSFVLNITDVYIGRPSPLGNPFSHLDQSHTIKCETREEAVSRYREWLRKEFVRKDSPARRELLRLVELRRQGKKLNLICWCAPLACHGDVLRDAITKIISSEKKEGSEE